MREEYIGRSAVGLQQRNIRRLLERNTYNNRRLSYVDGRFGFCGGGNQKENMLNIREKEGT